MMSPLDKSAMIFRMAEELDEDIRKREGFHAENGRHPSIGYDVGLFDGISKRQLLADITRLRRELQQLANLIEEEL